MARYIDADALIEFITKGLNNPDNTKAFGYDAIVILTEIEYAPTADVVPKSEVMNMVGGYYERCDECRRNCASAVAREIFEEIENSCVFEFGNSRIFIPENFAELKKKYVEDLK